MKFPNPEKLQKAGAILLIAGFVALLWLPTLDSFFDLDKAPPPNEKRAPAKKPELKTESLHSVREFLAGWEKYFSDHFGFRKRLIRWEHRWKRDLFKESTLSDVIVGRDGWLFFGGDRMIEHYRGTRLFTDEALAKWKKLLETRRDWCQQRGIKYIFVVVPDKHTIYPEYLPEWMTRVGNETKLDQFVAYMRKNSTVPVLDLRDCLLKAKEQKRVYQFTDSHWNFFGAFVAYQELVKELGHQLPSMEPKSLNDFVQKVQPKGGGDLAEMLSEAQSMPEKDYEVFEPVPPLQAIQIETVTNLLNKKWTRSAEPMVTTNPNAQGTAVMFRDSFAGGWVPFLGYNFNRVCYIWQYNWDKAFIEKERPVVVIDEMLERFLNKEHPDFLMEKDDKPSETIASHNAR